VFSEYTFSQPVLQNSDLKKAILITFVGFTFIAALFFKLNEKQKAY
jgi:hypothetical protein